MKYLRVDVERGIAGQDITTFVPLDGDESDQDLEETAGPRLFITKGELANV